MSRRPGRFDWLDDRTGNEEPAGRFDYDDDETLDEGRDDPHQPDLGGESG